MIRKEYDVRTTRTDDSIKHHDLTIKINRVITSAGEGEV